MTAEVKSQNFDEYYYKGDGIIIVASDLLFSLVYDLLTINYVVDCQMKISVKQNPPPPAL